MTDPVSLTQPQWNVLAKAATGRGYEYSGEFTKTTERLFMLALVSHASWRGKRYLLATDAGRAALRQGGGDS